MSTSKYVVILNFSLLSLVLFSQLRDRSNLSMWFRSILSSVLPVCSTTLWVGQVDKKATQQDLTNLFEEFGQIESINVSISC